MCAQCGCVNASRKLERVCTGHWITEHFCTCGSYEHGDERASERRPQPAWLLVATDSATAIAELRALVNPTEFEVLHASGTRGEEWGAASDSVNLGRSREAASKHFIEARNERGLVDRAAVVASFFADVELLSRADAFVGTAASWTSRICFLAIVGEMGEVPPFAWVDRPLGQLWFA